MNTFISPNKIVDYRENKVVLEQLCEETKKLDVIPFVGAGISKQFDFPLWEGFLLGVAKEVGIHEEIKELTKQNEYEKAAERLCSFCGMNEFRAYIKKEFGNKERLEGDLRRGAVACLPLMGKGPVVTTNFDRLLEKVFRQSGFRFSKVVLGDHKIRNNEAIRENRHILLKIHGDAYRGKIVLTAQEYTKSYKDGTLGDLLYQILSFRVVLFLGCSLDKDKSVEYAKTALEIQGARNFAIVEAPSSETCFEQRKQYLESIGINPIWFPPKRFELIEYILKYVIEKKQVNEWREKHKKDYNSWAAKKGKKVFLKGDDLAVSRKMLANKMDRLNENEAKYINASVIHYQSQKIKVFGAAIFLLIITIISVSKLYLQEKQIRQSMTAKLLATQANVMRNERPSLLQDSILISAEAVKRFPCGESTQALFDSLMLNRPLKTSISHDDSVDYCIYSPNGRYLATRDSRGVYVWNAENGSNIASLPHAFSPVNLKIGSKEFPPNNTYFRLLTFSPDNKYIAYTTSQYDDRHKQFYGSLDNNGRYGGSIGICEISGGKEITHMVHKSTINFIEFSRDGNFLLSCSMDQTARLWKVESGKEVYCISFKTVVEKAVFSPDSKYMAIICNDHNAYIYRTQNGQMIKKFRHKGFPHNVSFTPDGRCLITQSSKIASFVSDNLWRWQGNEVCIWDIDLGREINHIYQDDDNQMRVSPDGKYLATWSIGDWIYNAHIVELSTGKEVMTITHQRDITHVSFSPKSDYLVTSSLEGTARVWQISTGQEVARLTHENGISSAEYSPNGSFIATTGEDNVAKIWSISELPHVTREFPGEPSVISSNHKYLASYDREGFVSLWDVNRQRKIKKINLTPVLGPRWFLERMKISNHGDYLSVNSPEYVHVLDVKKQSEILRFPIPTPFILTRQDFTPDEHYLIFLSACEGNIGAILSIVDLKRHQLVVNKMIPWIIRANMAISPDGKFLAIGPDMVGIRAYGSITKEDTIKSGRDTFIVTRFQESDSFTDVTIIRIEDGEVVVKLKHDHPVSDLTFSPNSKYLATTSKNQCQIWNTSNWNRENDYFCDEYISSLTFSPDGRKMAISSSDEKTFHILSVPDLSEIAKKRFEWGPEAIAFDSKGRNLAVLLSNQTVIILNPGNQEIMKKRVERAVRSVAFSPDNRYLITDTGSSKVAATLWRSQDLLFETQEYVDHNISYYQWSRLFGNEPYKKTFPNLPENEDEFE